MIDIQKEFNKHEDDYLEFKRIENPPSKRSDICAFLLLDKLVPGDRDIVSYARHNKFFIGIDPEELAKVATSDDVLYLVRCGVRYDSDTDSLAMFT